MSFATATATDFADLMLRIRDFLTAQGHAHGKAFTGTGNGNLTAYAGTATSVAETWTLTATTATNFTVSGSVTGAASAATVGSAYSIGRIGFTITAGATAYIAGDIWRIQTSPAWTLSRALNGCYVPDKTVTGTWVNGPNLFDQSAATNAQVLVANLPAAGRMKLIAAAEVLEVGITPTAGTHPSAFTIDHSPDGTTWTTATTYTGITTGWTAGVLRRFAVTPAGNRAWWRVNFTATPNASVQINALDFYLTANSAWSLTNDWPHMVVRPLGNDGLLSSVFLSILAVDQPAADTYNIYSAPGTAFDPNGNWMLPGAGGQVWTAVGNFSMPYWLVANGRRFAAAIKVSTTYHCMYFGMMLPYARPSAYPLPLFNGGSIGSALRWSTTTDACHNYPRGNQLQSQGFVRDITATWREVAVQSAGANTTNVARMSPTALSNLGSMTFCRENFGGSYPLLPLVPCVQNVGPMGELDGVFWTSGFSNVAENIIVDQRYDLVVMHNVYRTTISDYFAMRLD